MAKQKGNADQLITEIIKGKDKWLGDYNAWSCDGFFDKNIGNPPITGKSL